MIIKTCNFFKLKYIYIYIISHKKHIKSKNARDFFAKSIFFNIHIYYL